VKIEELKQSIVSLSPAVRLELMEWIEAAVARTHPRTSPSIEHLQLDVLKFPPDDMLDLSQWIVDITFERQPKAIGDLLDGLLGGKASSS
jgi:hypothetical protein